MKEFCFPNSAFPIIVQVMDGNVRKSRRKYMGRSWKERKTQKFDPLPDFLVHKLVLNFRDGDVHDKKMS